MIPRGLPTPSPFVKASSSADMMRILSMDGRKASSRVVLRSSLSVRVTNAATSFGESLDVEQSGLGSGLCSAFSHPVDAHSTKHAVSAGLIE